MSIQMLVLLGTTTFDALFRDPPATLRADDVMPRVLILRVFKVLQTSSVLYYVIGYVKVFFTKYKARYYNSELG